MTNPIAPNNLPFSYADLVTPTPKLPGAQGIEASDAAPQARDPEKEKLAKSFESMLMVRMLEEMKKSIGNWGLEKDPASDQVQGIFWMHLAEEVGAKGGIGLWEKIYDHIAKQSAPGQDEKPAKGLDTKL